MALKRLKKIGYKFTNSFGQLYCSLGSTCTILWDVWIICFELIPNDQKIELNFNPFVYYVKHQKARKKTEQPKFGTVN